MIVTARHTSAAEAVKLDLDVLPSIGDAIMHPALGRSIVSHVYPSTHPVVVLVHPRGEVHGGRLDVGPDGRTWHVESSQW